MIDHILMKVYFNYVLLKCVVIVIIIIVMPGSSGKCFGLFNGGYVRSLQLHSLATAIGVFVADK